MMLSMFQVADCEVGERHEGINHYAMCTTLDKAIAVAATIINNHDIYGELLIIEYGVDIFPDVVGRIYDHLGNPQGVDPI